MALSIIPSIVDRSSKSTCRSRHQTPRDQAFCAHAILEDEVLIVPDTHLDRRFADNPLVTGAPYIRFYAGNPIRSPERFRIGTLCVIDMRPRELDERQIDLLKNLTALVERELALLAI